MAKVFGIGWTKTGTTTLGKCFEILGYDHQSQNLGLVKDIANGDLSKIIEQAQKKDTFEDWPWIILYKELDEAFPESRFVLTTRNPKKWIRSYKNMLEKQGKASEELNKIRRILYGLPFPNVSESQLIDRYLRHNNEVKSYFQNRTDNLLVIDWEAGDGWEKLCEFLMKDIPANPFPHENQGLYSTGYDFSKLFNRFRK